MVTPPDMQLVAREAPPGWTNLAIGEPWLIQRWFEPMYPHRVDIRAVSYPPCEGLPDVVSTVGEALRRIGITKAKVVLTNGGKQALCAAFYALNKVHGVKEISTVIPYWPSLPTLAKLTGLEWRHGSTSKIEVWPNNPTGNSQHFRPNQPAEHTIWDAAYASPLYGWRGDVPIHTIGLSSMSKLFGCSGLRIGWAWSKDERISDAMAEYMELSTSGVSVAAQEYLLKFSFNIKRERNFYRDFAKRASRNLNENGELFNEQLGDYVEEVSGVPANHGGMFAWFKAKDEEHFAEALQNAKVQLVPGSACGMQVPGWYRMNLAVVEETLEPALQRLNKELKR